MLPPMKMTQKLQKQKKPKEPRTKKPERINISYKTESENQINSIEFKSLNIAEIPFIKQFGSVWRRSRVESDVSCAVWLPLTHPTIGCAVDA